MKIVILTTNRLLKLLGHTSKLLCYPFHFVFPNKRFTLPKKSGPILSSKKKSIIPKTIWQTNFTNQVTLPVYLNYLCNRIMTPSYDYRFVSTEERADFIKESFPDAIYQRYQRLNVGASQADLWRLLVLQKHGGIYMDIDAHLVWPATGLIKPTDNDLFLRVKKIEDNHYSNYFIASKPNNPILEETLQLILENIDDGNRHTSVYDLTGPEVLNTVLEKKEVNYIHYRYLCIQGSFTNEHFQYLDKPRGKWTYVKPEDLLAPKKESL